MMSPEDFAELAATAVGIRDACVKAGVTSNEIIAAVIVSSSVAESLRELDVSLDRIRHELDYIGERLNK